MSVPAAASPVPAGRSRSRLHSAVLRVAVVVSALAAMVIVYSALVLFSI